jgi:sec-independent protein translocase protein TatB
VLDIGFSELMVIGVVALIVIGPERLPRVARTAGHLLGRFQRYVSEVKADINREIELSELKSIRSSMEDAARSIESTVKSEMHSVEDGFRSAQAQLDGAGEALEQAQQDINRSLAPFASPHLSVGADSQSGAALEPARAGTSSAAGAGAGSDRSGGAEGSEGPSPQLELGLAASAPPAQPEPHKQS